MNNNCFEFQSIDGDHVFTFFLNSFFVFRTRISFWNSKIDTIWINFQMISCGKKRKKKPHTHKTRIYPWLLLHLVSSFFSQSKYFFHFYSVRKYSRCGTEDKNFRKKNELYTYTHNKWIKLVIVLLNKKNKINGIFLWKTL